PCDPNATDESKPRVVVPSSTGAAVASASQSFDVPVIRRCATSMPARRSRSRAAVSASAADGTASGAGVDVHASTPTSPEPVDPVDPVDPSDPSNPFTAGPSVGMVVGSAQT